MNAILVAGAEEDQLQVAPPLSDDPDANRRRYTISVLIGAAVSVPLYLWVLLGGRANPLFTDFYEIQARALFEGHWYVPKGSLGIEAFVHHGRDYMYFGPFPSLLRMPILALTSSLDGRLTAPSLLLAWLCTGFFACVLLWRVRLLIRGSEALRWAEAASYGALIAALMAGSVLMFMGSIPYVYNEDLVWGVALTIGAMFALLGVLEGATWHRIAALFALILAVNLSRLTLGWACVIGALLGALWLGLGYGGETNRRWWLPVLACGLGPLLISCYVTWAKFGIPFGLPMADQVWTQISVHRRQFLAANGGKAYNLAFIPTNALAYLGPTGLRLTSVFPFFTLPAGPPLVVGSVVFDMTYRTGSAPATMPLMFLLAVGGAFAAFRPRPSGRARLTCIPLLAAAAGVVGVLVWGYIANRYLADFVPLLFLGSTVGLVDLWHRVRVGRRLTRRGILAAVGALAALSILINLALADTPSGPDGWQGSRIQNYVHLQESLSSITGNPIDGNVMRGSTLPAWAPADSLFVLNHCAALYISDGEQYAPWIPVDYGPGAMHILDITLRGAVPSGPTPILSLGRDLKDTVSVQYGGDNMRFALSDPLLPNAGPWIRLQPNRRYRVTLVADAPLQTLTVVLNGQVVLTSTISTFEPVSVPITHPTSSVRGQRSVTVTQVPVGIPALCRPFVGGG